jgi:hypothetical protein
MRVTLAMPRTLAPQEHAGKLDLGRAPRAVRGNAHSSTDLGIEVETFPKVHIAIGRAIAHRIDAHNVNARADRWRVLVGIVRIGNRKRAHAA